MLFGLAHDSADAEMVATDLLGQAEHGPSSPATLLTTSEKLASEIESEIQRQLKTLPTADVAGVAWKNCGSVLLVDSEQELISEANKIVKAGQKPGRHRGPYHAFGVVTPI